MSLENNIENVEEIVEEVQEVVEETVEEVVEEVEELEKPTTPTAKKMKKHLEAKKLVEEAKSIVQASDNEIDDCKLLLENDLKDYTLAKTALKEGGLDAAKALLLELGYTASSELDEEEDSVIFEAKDDVEPIVLKDVSSGKFTGFILSLFGGAATLGGLVYWATEKLGMTLYVDKIPSNETIQQIFGFFGTQVGRSGDATNGGLLVGAIVLAVMALIYLVRVSLKGSSNLHFATEQMKETEKYIEHKANCKEEMDKVDLHITDAINVLKDYEVVLNEQNGKLKRVLHFEGQQENSADYHTKSTAEMKATQNLLDSIGRFISTPMSEEGKLSGKSSLFLHSAKENLQKVLSNFS